MSKADVKRILKNKLEFQHVDGRMMSNKEIYEEIIGLIAIGLGQEDGMTEDVGREYAKQLIDRYDRMHP